MEKKSSFFWWKVALTGISFLGVIFFKSNINWSDFCRNYIDLSLCKEIAYDLSIGIFSAMILVWFIDEIGNHIQEHKSKSKERDTIKRFDKVLQKYIEKYITMFYCVATPMDNRDFENVIMPENFTLRDMKDLHKPTLLLKEKWLGASVESFLQIELDLRKELISLVERFDFDYYPQFPQLFLQFIQASLTYDSRLPILDVANKYAGDKQLTDIIHHLLEDDADSYYEKMINGEDISGYIGVPYILLYELMRQERKLIIQYQAEIETLS